MNKKDKVKEILKMSTTCAVLPNYTVTEVQLTNETVDVLSEKIDKA